MSTTTADNIQATSATPRSLNPFKALSKARRREALFGYAFISPWVIGLLIFTVGPFIASLLLSFTSYSILQPGKWVGLDNYVRAFTNDPLFWQSLRNTVIYVVGATLLRVSFGFVLALLLNTKIRFMALWRTLFYVPSIVPIVATTMIWLFVLNPRFGLLNWFLGLFGIDRLRWLTSPDTAMLGLLVMSVWWVGGTMIIFLAGLQGIPEDYYDAAKIDGAGPLAQLARITIPLMTPTIFFNIIINVISTFQVFTQALIMTGGGPLNSTRFYMLHLYEHAFSYIPPQMGYASALAWILFVIIFVLSLVVVRSSNRWVFYS